MVGELVTERGLAEWFSVARPTAKAAVERLVHDGLLQRSENTTARVQVLGVEDVRDLGDVTSALPASHGS